jgi:hypothetical protein
MGRAYSTTRENRTGVGRKAQWKEHSYHHRMQNQYVELQRTRLLTVRETFCTVSSYFTPSFKLLPQDLAAFRNLFAYSVSKLLPDVATVVVTLPAS